VDYISDGGKNMSEARTIDSYLTWPGDSQEESTIRGAEWLLKQGGLFVQIMTSYQHTSKVADDYSEAALMIAGDERTNAQAVQDIAATARELLRRMPEGEIGYINNLNALIEKCNNYKPNDNISENLATSYCKTLQIALDSLPTRLAEMHLTL
jgi:hypothetical protein